MLTSSYILIISAVFLLAFVGRKTYLLRAGALTISHEERKWRIKYELYKVYRIIRFISRRLFKYAIFTIGKLWINTEIVALKFLRNKFPKYFKEKEELVPQKPSFFISTMQEYKVRMRRYKKKVEDKHYGKEGEEEEEL